MTPERIAELRALKEAATGGTWEVCARIPCIVFPSGKNPSICDTSARGIDRPHQECAANAALIVAAVNALGPLLDKVEAMTWSPIETAPKDGNPIIVLFRDDLAEKFSRPDLSCWEDRQCVMHHPGLADDGFDIGWSVSAPAGYGGIPDEWLLAWMPLPSPPEPRP